MYCCILNLVDEVGNAIAAHPHSLGGQPDEIDSPRRSGPRISRIGKDLWKSKVANGLVITK
jgi:hypothetical protein